MKGILSLRDYQVASLDALRDGIRQGMNHQVLMAPTAAGKTVMAASLIDGVNQKMKRAVFVVDRVSLVDQTSALFDYYGIPHGVMQANHWRCRPWERIQVASAQTLSRRGFPKDIDLLIVDEAHTMYASTINFLKANKHIRVVGLTATPFTKGMGEIYGNLVNVTTTNQLVRDGFLTPLKMYVARAADMTGAKVVAGEWSDDEVEKRGMDIVGDIVGEWVAKTHQHFGGPAKTIGFGATVNHCESLAAEFQAAGYNFRVISYRDGNDENRKRLIDEFRKPDSEIVGLLSCEALAKGFDVPDIKIGIGARPYRKSLSSHIQQLGRVMRVHPGKEYGLWLDHAGNLMRFYADTEEIFEDGLKDFKGTSLDSSVRKEPEEKERKDVLCHICKCVLSPKQDTCPACGAARKRMKDIHAVAGELVEITSATAKKGWLADKEDAWRQIVGEALRRKAREYWADFNFTPDSTFGDYYNGKANSVTSIEYEAAERFAKAQYKSIFGTWPKRAMRNVVPKFPSGECQNYIKSRMIAFANRKAA